MTIYKVGDVVEWSSAANGSWKTKRGTITKVWIDFPYWGAPHRKQCVKVSVPASPLRDGTPSKAKPMIYQPRVSALKLISEVA